MISWHIWQSINRPFVAHPLYRRYGMWHQNFTRVQPGLAAKLRRHIERREEWWLGGVLLAIILSVVFFGVTPLLVVTAALVFLGGGVLFPLSVLFSSTFYGMAIATHISDAIAEEKSQGRYIFMALTPYGLAGTAWALCSVTMHTHQNLLAIRHNLLRNFFMVTFLIGLIAFFSVGVYLAFDNLVSLNTVWITLDALVVAFIVLVDYMQSTIIGAITGMLVPELAKTRSDTRSLALGIFFSAQVSTYVLVAVLCGFLWPWVYQSMDWALIPTFPVACLATFYVCRELLILGLWLNFAWQTNTRLSELERFTRVDIERALLFMVGKRILRVNRRDDTTRTQKQPV